MVEIHVIKCLTLSGHVLKIGAEFLRYGLEAFKNYRDTASIDTLSGALGFKT